MIEFNPSQIDRLSELFADIAKGLFLASILVPAISTLATKLETLRSTIGGIFFAYLSVKILEVKEKL